MSYKHDEYLVQLVENFEKLLEERRCRVRQEMMKYRMEMEAEFKMKMKSFVFQSIMSLRQKVNESNRRLKSISKENDRPASPVENKTCSNDVSKSMAIVQDKLQQRNDDVINRSLMISEMSLRGEERKTDDEFKGKWHSWFTFEQKQNESIDNMYNGTKGSIETGTYDVRNETESIENLSNGKKGSIKNGKRDVRNETESMIDPKFLESNVVGINCTDSDDASPSLDSSSYSIETVITDECLMSQIEKNTSEEFSVVTGNNFTKNNRMQTVEGRHLEAEADNSNDVTETWSYHEKYDDTADITTTTTTTTATTPNCDWHQNKDDGLSLSNLLVNSSAESALSEIEASLPLGDILNMQSKMATHLDTKYDEESARYIGIETSVNEEALRDVGMEATDEQWNGRQAFHSLEMELQEKENIHNDNADTSNKSSLFLPNIYNFGFSPRSPSKYRKFKSERESRKNSQKGNTLDISMDQIQERENKPLTNSDSDDLWLVTPLAAIQSSRTEDHENDINSAENLVFVYDTENQENEPTSVKGMKDKTNLEKQYEVKKKAKSRIPVKIKKA